MAKQSTPDAYVPSDDERHLAAVAHGLIAELDAADSSPRRVCISIECGGGHVTAVDVPAFALQLLKAALGHWAKGDAVAVAPTESELTTQEAAKLLNMSRPHLVGLIERGEIPCRKVGAHRRLRVRDVLAYRDHARRKALGALQSQAQELGMGYEP